MTCNQVFLEWAANLPQRRKIQIAKEILLIKDNIELTKNEQKIAREAEEYLLSCNE